MDVQESRADRRAALRPVTRRWWLVVTIGLIVSALTYIYFDRQPDSYTATTTLVTEPSTVRSALGEGAPAGDPIRAALNEAIRVVSTDVAAEAAREIGYEGDPGALRGAISASPIENTDFLRISATTENAARATELANAFAGAYIRVRADEARESVRAAIAALQRRQNLLESTGGSRAQQAAIAGQIARLEVFQTLPPSTAQVFEEAGLPGASNAGSPGSRAVFGLLIGLLVGVGAAFVLGTLERRINWSGDVESIYRQPVLAQLPHARLPAQDAGGIVPSEDLAESFRTLRTNLQLTGLGIGGATSSLRTILVTSAVGGEGKSTVVRNLAVAYSESGARVAVVDADLRKPDLSRTLAPESERSPGLTEVAAGSARLEDVLGVAEIHRNGSANGNVARGRIALLGPGAVSADPAAILSSEGVRAALVSLVSAYDIVIIDSSPLLPVSDALPLLSYVDGVLITTRVGVTTRSAAEQLTEVMDRVVGAELLGVVANDVRVSEGLRTYGYYGSERRTRRLRSWR